MSEKRYPDRNRDTKSAYDRENEPESANQQNDDLRLWGPETESEPTQYGDLRDQSFQAGSTSKPASMDEETTPKHGWRAEDVPHQEHDEQPDEPEREQREKANQHTSKDHTA